MPDLSMRQILQTKGVPLTLGIRRLVPRGEVIRLRVLMEMPPYCSVPDFLPSTSGLHFSNSYPKNTSYPVIDLPVIGPIVSGDAGKGICGGFAYTVLDLFLHDPRLQPPPDTERPDPGTPRFNYLVERLIDSFGAAHAFNQAAKAIQWTQTPNHDTGFDTLAGHVVTQRGLAWRVAVEEWPKIKEDIDAGRPSPLWIVTAPQCGIENIEEIPLALSHNHQVLAYAYTLDADKNLTLYIYDCNHPNDDSATIALNISNPEHTIKITASTIGSEGSEIRGFFRPDYEYKDAQKFLLNE